MSRRPEQWMNRRRGGEYGAAGGRKSQVRIQEQWMDGSHSHLGPPCPLEPGTVVQYTARGGRASKTSDDAAAERSFPLLTRESTRLPGRRWMSGGNLEGRTTKLHAAAAAFVGFDFEAEQSRTVVAWSQPNKGILSHSSKNSIPSVLLLCSLTHSLQRWMK